MSKVHIARQGFLTKSAIPNATRVVGTTTGNSSMIVNANESVGNVSNTEVIDSSSNNLYVSQMGNWPSQCQFSPFPAGTSGAGSILFSGFANWLQCQNPTQLTLGTGDFTIELWFWTADATNVRGIYDQRNQNVSQVVPTIYTTSNSVRFFVSGADRITSGASTISTNTWYHVAIVRISGVTKMYLNGTQVGSNYSDTNNYVGFAGRPLIGSNGSGTTYTTYSDNSSFRGFISNLRVVKGIGVYTGNFTVPTSPLTSTQSAGTNIAAISGTETSLLLNFTNYRIVDSSTANPKGVVPLGYNLSPLGGQTNFSPYSGSGKYGSFWLDGTFAFFDTPTSADYSFAGDFTIETWLYLQTANVARTFIEYAGPTTATSAYYFEVTAGNKLSFSPVVSTTRTTVTSTSNVPTNQWVHVAAVRSGTTVRLFINGVQDPTTGTVTGTVNQGGYPMRIGSAITTGSKTNGSISFFPTTFYSWQNVNGYMTGFRIVNGTAVYTGNFTPPNVQPVDIDGSSSAASYTSTTNVNITFPSANTKMLLKFDNWTMADSSTLPKPLYPTGNIQISNTPSKFSNNFNGDPDSTISLVYCPSSALNFGTSDFTVAQWVYGNFSTNINLWSTGTMTGTGGGATQRMFAYIEATTRNVIIGRVSSTNLVTFGAVGSGLANTWFHVAIVRFNGVITCYIDGVALASTVSYSSQLGDIGASFYNYTATGVPLLGTTNGYHDNIVVAPFAMYTSNFTPPGSAITDPITYPTTITNNTYGVYQNY